jgi:acyl-coenzyme A synthetase/AMP-(fatty) acid ligase
VKLLTRRRKRVADPVHNGSYDAAALIEALEEGSWRVPDRFNFTRDVVEILARDPKRRALTFLGKDGVIEPRSFHRLAEDAARWAILMRENGVEPGDRILVVLGKTPDWLEVMLASLKVGAVAVPCPETMSAAALGIRISGAGAKLVVAGEASAGELSRIADAPQVLYTEETRKLFPTMPSEAPTHDTSSRDPAFVLTTSGAASGPRGVVHTHGSTFAARLQAEHWLDAGPDDAVWCTADASTGVAVWNALLGPWSRGAEVVLHQEPFDPAERLTCIRRLDTTILCQTPREYAALLSAADISRHRPPKLRRLVATGDYLRPDVVSAYEEAWDLTICDGYGQVETGVVVASGAGAGVRPGSIGLPLPGLEVVVVDEQGSELEPGIEGELAVRGRPPTLFSSYWDSPDETKAAFRGDLYLTGDVARSDEDGFLWFLGRKRDLITSGGGHFGPIEVEEALAHHAAVAEAAAVGMRDLQRGGHYVRAFVVLEGGFEPSDRLVAEIREHARQSLAGHEVPREIEFVDALPTTSDGKVKRGDLRERPVVGLAPVWSPSPSPTLAPEPQSAPDPVSEPEGAAVAPPDAVAELPAEPVVESPAGFEQAVEFAPVESPTVEPVEPQPTVLHTEQLVELEAEPEPVVLEPEAHEPGLEPVAFVAEPEPVVLEPVAPESVAPPEPPMPEPEPPMPEPEPPMPEPEPPMPEPEPEALAPEPEPVSEPDPVPEPEALVPELQPLPLEVVEPAPEPEPPVLGPEPKHEPEPAALEPEALAPELTPEVSPAGPADELVLEPLRQPEPDPEPVAEVIPLVEPAPDPDSEELPDYVVVPGSERPAHESPIAPADLSFPTVPELVLEPATEQGTTEPRTADREETPDEPQGDRRASDRRTEKDRRRRSSHEPGDEGDETGWMQGLSNRLSAYSLSEDGSGPDDAESDPDSES